MPKKSKTPSVPRRFQERHAAKHVVRASDNVDTMPVDVAPTASEIDDLARASSDGYADDPASRKEAIRAPQPNRPDADLGDPVAPVPTGDALYGQVFDRAMRQAMHAEMPRDCAPAAGLSSSDVVAALTESGYLGGNRR